MLEAAKPQAIHWEDHKLPTYEYQCDACKHNFDELQSFSEKPLKKCPKCGKSKLRRVFGIEAAVLFKGSGFYQTDYRSESYKKDAKAEQESSKPASETKAETKTDSTGAAGKTGKADKGSSGSSGKSSKSDG